MQMISQEWEITPGPVAKLSSSHVCNTLNMLALPTAHQVYGRYILCGAVSRRSVEVL